MIFLVILAVPMIMLIGLLVGFYNAFILSILWNWFVAPYTGVQLATLSAWGIMVVVGIMTGHYRVSESSKDDSGDIANSIGKVFGYSLGYTVILGIAWCVRTFLM